VSARLSTVDRDLIRRIRARGGDVLAEAVRDVMADRDDARDAAAAVVDTAVR
jgi:hypothetical protein